MTVDHLVDPASLARVRLGAILGAVNFIALLRACACIGHVLRPPDLGAHPAPRPRVASGRTGSPRATRRTPLRARASGQWVRPAPRPRVRRGHMVAQGDEEARLRARACGARRT
ncbi:hypothetical protein [Sinosporangium siamense]|uniref:hypothetical protein n=1 Tax=Sinosporangium siamense TaxID=1367973 RepID=UPI0019510452|nr:hypothetical protein [Sinosporangium siamense]